MKTSKLFKSSIISLSLLLVPVTAFADTGSKTSDLGVTIEAGEFKFEAPDLKAVETVKLSEEDKSITFLTTGSKGVVTDNRGSQVGWNVTVSATQFTEVGAPADKEPFKLPLGSLTMKESITVNPSTATQSALPTSLTAMIDFGLKKELVEETALDVSATGSPVKVYSAPENAGMGVYELLMSSDTLKLNINSASTKVRVEGTPTTYSSTITWNLISGPGGN